MAHNALLKPRRTRPLSPSFLPASRRALVAANGRLRDYNMSQHTLVAHNALLKPRRTSPSRMCVAGLQQARGSQRPVHSGRSSAHRTNFWLETRYSLAHLAVSRAARVALFTPPPPLFTLMCGHALPLLSPLHSPALLHL